MSWIVGFCGPRESNRDRERLRRLHSEPLFQFGDEAIYVAAGGIAETCRAGHLDGSSDFWVVAGPGILRQDDGCELLGSTDWAERLRRPQANLDGLDGHYVVLTYRSRTLTIQTDTLGVRSVYFAKTRSGLVFATQLDRLVAFTGYRDPDPGVFGSHWLLFNQLSHGSLVRGIQRLGAGGRVIYTAGGRAKEHQSHWMPPVIDSADQRGERFTRTVKSLLRPALPSGSAVSLGLSGGLDSRFLLSLSFPEPVRTHVFGPEAHPDVAISKRIASDESLEQLHFHEDIPDTAECLALLRSHVAQAHAVSPASSIVGLRHYSELRSHGLTMVDGGFGEIMRRQYFNRLLRRGKRALHSRDSDGLISLLSSHRVDVFQADFRRDMQSGFKEQIDLLCDSLPDPHDLEMEHLVDLIGVRARLPNFFGFEQSRLDSLVQNFMPLAQPSVVAAVFRLPLALRRNGRLVRRFIRANTPRLARYPLAKSGTTYPFSLPTLGAHAWTTGKSAIGMRYSDSVRGEFLSRMRKPALDFARSRAVRESGIYDPEAVVHLVESYYAGSAHLAAEVDWWLALEVWRQTVLEASQIATQADPSSR